MMAADRRVRPGPLQGKTVVLTRGAGAPDGWASRLVRLGADVAHYPCFTVRPLPLDAASEAVVQELLPHVGWLAFASRHGVRLMHTWLQRWGIGLPEPARLAAVGPATERVVVQLFARPCLLAQPATGDGLAATLLRHALPRDGVVLLPAAGGGRRVVLDALVQANFRVHFLPLYETVIEPDGSVIPPLPPHVDYIFMTSPSCVRGFLARTGLPPGSKVISIGPTTSAAALEHGVTVTRQAAVPSFDSMLDALMLEL